MTATFHPSQNFHRVSREIPIVSRPVGAAPNYLARRVMVVLVAVAVIAASAVAVGQAVGALADLGGRPAAASEIAAPGAVAAPRLHVAAAGDTMWSIAESYRGTTSRDRYVDALIDLNGGTTVQVGQAVRLP